MRKAIRRERRQSSGAVLSRAGKLVEAEGARRESLQKQARDGRVLFELWKTPAEREAHLVEQDIPLRLEGGRRQASWRRGPGFASPAILYNALI